MAEILLSQASTTTRIGEIPRWNQNVPREFAIFVNIEIFGSGNITPNVEVLDTVSGEWFLAVELDPIMGAGKFTIPVRRMDVPGMGPDFKLEGRFPEVPNVRIRMEHSNASEHTYSVAVYFYTRL